MSNREEGEDELEWSVPVRDASHRNSVRTDDNRINFEFMSKDNSNINLIMNNHNVDTSITTPDITQGARNLLQTDSEHEDEVYTKEDNADVSPNNKKVIYIRKDYIPRDKITDAHIISIIGSKYKYSKEIINKEKISCQNMKDEFNKFARRKIKSGFIDAVNSMQWNIKGQPITNMQDLKNYIASHKWDEVLQKQLHYLHYKRFKIDMKYCRWDHILSNEFCKFKNIKYFQDKEDTRALIAGKERNKRTRPCFPILAVAIKSDINCNIRKTCKKIHNACIKERADDIIAFAENDDGNKLKSRSHWNWSNSYNRNKDQGKEREILQQNDEVRNLKEKVKSLEGKLVNMRQTAVDSFADFVFENNDDGVLVSLNMKEKNYSHIIAPN